MHFDRPLLADLPADLFDRAEARSLPCVMIATW